MHIGEERCKLRCKHSQVSGDLMSVKYQTSSQTARRLNRVGLKDLDVTKQTERLKGTNVTLIVCMPTK